MLIRGERRNLPFTGFASDSRDYYSFSTVNCLPVNILRGAIVEGCSSVQSDLAALRQIINRHRGALNFAYFVARAAANRNRRCLTPAA